MSFTIGLNICVMTARTKKYKSITKKKERKYVETILLAKTNLDCIKGSISRSLTNSCIECSYFHLTLYRMGIFVAAHGCGGGRTGGKKAPFPKIFHTYHTIMKLGAAIHYLMQIQKMYEWSDPPLDVSWHQPFFTGNEKMSKFCDIKKYRHRLPFGT